MLKNKFLGIGLSPSESLGILFVVWRLDNVLEYDPGFSAPFA